MAAHVTTAPRASPFTVTSPLAAVGYDCHNDKRIRSKFDQRVVSPGLGKLFGAVSSA